MSLTGFGQRVCFAQLWTPLDRGVYLVLPSFYRVLFLHRRNFAAASFFFIGRSPRVGRWLFLFCCSFSIASTGFCIGHVRRKCASRCRPTKQRRRNKKKKKNTESGRERERERERERTDRQMLSQCQGFSASEGEKKRTF